MNDGLARRIATVFGLGEARPAPGTLASLAALPLAALLSWLGGPLLVLFVAAILFGIGISAGAVWATHLGTEDPSDVVIDEVVGQLIALALLPLDPWCYGLGFALFRLFDIWKPGPVGWADRHVKGGMGIMLDDIVAGAMAGLIAFVFSLFHLTP